MRNYNGEYACQSERRRIKAAGYICAFTTLYIDRSCPPEIMKASNDGGWATRRAIKDWARRERIEDYLIFRATDYLRDLHGTTYEVYLRADAQRAER